VKEKAVFQQIFKQTLSCDILVQQDWMDCLWIQLGVYASEPPFYCSTCN